MGEETRKFPQEKLAVYAAVESACEDVGTNNTFLGRFSVDQDATLLLSELFYRCPEKFLFVSIDVLSDVKIDQNRFMNLFSRPGNWKRPVRTWKPSLVTAREPISIWMMLNCCSGKIPKLSKVSKRWKNRKRKRSQRLNEKQRKRKSI
ncbi:unnamed protein product, partial [Nesidiocoris tenuis]